MITHGVDVFMDDLRRTWCRMDLEPHYPEPTDDAVIDCMSCLVQKARDESIDVIGRVIALSKDGMVEISPLIGSVQRWR